MEFSKVEIAQKKLDTLKNLVADRKLDEEKSQRKPGWNLTRQQDVAEDHAQGKKSEIHRQCSVDAPGVRQISLRTGMLEEVRWSI